MPKVYAEDLLRLEDELEKLTAERAALEAKPAIIRRLKKDQIAELDTKIHETRWQVVSWKEQVSADATSSAMYEAETKARRKEAQRAQRSVLPEAQRGLPEQKGELPPMKAGDRESLIASMKKPKPKNIGEKTLEYAKLLEQEREPE